MGEEARWTDYHSHCQTTFTFIYSHNRFQEKTTAADDLFADGQLRYSDIKSAKEATQ